MATKTRSVPHPGRARRRPGAPSQTGDAAMRCRAAKRRAHSPPSRRITPPLLRSSGPASRARTRSPAQGCTLKRPPRRRIGIWQVLCSFVSDQQRHGLKSGYDSVTCLVTQNRSQLFCLDIGISPKNYCGCLVNAQPSGAAAPARVPARPALVSRPGPSRP